MRETTKDILLYISIICVIVGAIAYANTRDANDSYLNAVQASIPAIGCVSDNDNTLAYSYYENGNLTCEKHEVYTSEDDKQRLAELKLAYPVRVK